MTVISYRNSGRELDKFHPKSDRIILHWNSHAHVLVLYHVCCYTYGTWRVRLFSLVFSQPKSQWVRVCEKLTMYGTPGFLRDESVEVPQCGDSVLYALVVSSAREIEHLFLFRRLRRMCARRGARRSTHMVCSML